jgi:hypothetical protein
MSESTPALDALAAAGVPLDSIDPEKRAVLASLSEEETTVLVGIIDKMEDEVEGFAMAGFQTPRLNPTLNPTLTPGVKPNLPGAMPGLDPGVIEDKGGVFW